MCPSIEVTPEEIRAAAQRLTQEAQSIEDAAHRSDSAVDNLRSMKGKRISKILEAWDALLKSLYSNVANVEQIAKEQSSAATDYGNADDA